MEEKNRDFGCFFEELFRDLKGAPLPSWVNQHWDPECLDDLEKLTGEFLLELLLGFKKNRTCAESRIVAEMLLICDVRILDLLAEMFKRRILNGPEEPQELHWHKHFVNLIAKPQGAHKVENFRPIAILDVLYKLYAKALMTIGHVNERPLEAPQFAFRKHFQGPKSSS